ncbi:MAG: Gfo/Idh/MocA family oxidoreductase [Gammaproteobacteria bacterium]|nr:Gfo/Idh/MocA family oxidoreductase [Gammaproteobacteria bacterium]
MNPIRCAVIGVGYLGRFHAQKLQALENTTLVAVCDVNEVTCKTASEEFNVPAYRDYHDLFGHIDAVCIAATTCAHYEIARNCLKQGIHVLIEKPITETVAEAEDLVKLADMHHVKLQVGHLERFNAARLALDEHLEKPLFIESNRLAPFNPRGTDVNVVLDLMIHDIDIIQSIVKSPIKSLDAQGAPVLSPSVDIANARITFENNCIANVTASRVSFKTERKTRIFQKNSYISIDYQEKQLAVFTKGDGEMFPGIPNVARHQSVFEKGDALLEEIKAFIACIVNNTKPLVTGEEGQAALSTAAKISDLIHHNLTERHAETCA